MKKILFTFVFFSCIVICGTPEKENSLLRKGSAVYEQRISNISNNHFYITNYGVYGQNVFGTSAGWYWPRASNKAYIFGQSIWFGAKKRVGAETLKVVSIGYNPNNGQATFVPGSVDDGLAALPSSDPRDKKYYMYLSTDFSSQGKNTVSPGKPDWPIRWKNSSKEPRKGGYFGDYIADTTERMSYPPVFISGEDMFCIYKDTDVSRNIEYAPNTGYPLGLDFLQTAYTWGSGPSKDFVFLAYSIVNKSSDTLRECYIGPAGDPDIGDGGNDHNAFYNTDSTLNLGYQYTEIEAGYPGIVGVDFLESPKIKTPLDSVLVFKKTGIAKKVGDQIGLTTFRNWSIDNDPSNGSARYDFMAAGVKDGDNAPGDKRLLMATGPFTLMPNDTARVVVCILIAPGNGNPTNGVSYFDSLVQLDKYAQSVYDNNFQLPTTSVGNKQQTPQLFALEQNYPNPFNPSTTLNFTVGTAANVSLKVYNVLGQLVTTLKNGYLQSGNYSVSWDGRNSAGLSVGSGVYVYRLESGSFIETKKMVLVR